MLKVENGDFWWFILQLVFSLFSNCVQFEQFKKCSMIILAFLTKTGLKNVAHNPDAKLSFWSFLHLVNLMNMTLKMFTESLGWCLDVLQKGFVLVYWHISIRYGCSARHTQAWQIVKHLNLSLIRAVIVALKRNDIGIPPFVSRSVDCLLIL